MENNFSYIGDELEIFSEAKNWKKYFSNHLKKYVSNSVLDVGAGIGTNYLYFNSDKIREWTFLEPDEVLLQKIPNYNNSIKINGTIKNINNTYNSIIYIDVIEHLEDPNNEFLEASKRVVENGYLVILCPAYQSLYSELDRQIGHFKRYSKKDFIQFSATNMSLVEISYLDSAGTILSFANKYLLKQKYPTKNQIKFWDKTIIPISKVLDKLIRYSFGKSVVGIWQKKVNV